MQYGGSLFVTDTEVHKCSVGVLAETFNDRAAKLVAHDSRFTECWEGVGVETENLNRTGTLPGGSATGLLVNCTASLCETGFGVVSAGGPADLTMTNCRAFENKVGLGAEAATVRLTNCVITGNQTGIGLASGAVLGTMTGTNLIDGNGTGNSVNGTVTLQ